MTGTKVEAIHHHGVGATEGFVVGRVLTCERHPDADRLSVCTVELGSAREGNGPATIVCGAPNVAAGQTVAVALPGAVMPGGMSDQAREAERGRLRRDDLCRAGARDRAWRPGESRAGRPDARLRSSRPERHWRTCCRSSIEVIELEVTPNRPDCLGVYGVARELHAATGAPLAPEPWREDPGSPGTAGGREIAVECTRPLPAVHRARVRATSRSLPRRRG